MNTEGSIALVTGANEAGEHEVLLDDWTGGALRAVRAAQRAPPRACDAGGKPVMSGDLLDTATALAARRHQGPGGSDGHDDDYEETSP